MKGVATTPRIWPASSFQGGVDGALGGAGVVVVTWLAAGAARLGRVVTRLGRVVTWLGRGQA